MRNFKFPFCISLVLWFFFNSVYMYQCGLGYLCRLENIEVLQRRNWSISTGNWSLVGVRVLMTSNSFTLLCRIVMVLHFTPHIHARVRTHVTRAPNVWEIFLLFYNNNNYYFGLPSRGKKREKKSKHKSRKSSNEAQNA
jgi:hypothetical protein